MTRSVAGVSPCDARMRTLRAIAQCDVAAAREFERITQAVLGRGARAAHADQGVLTPARAPLELAFGAAPSQWRYTMELGSGGVPPPRRLARALDLLAVLGADGLRAQAPTLWTECAVLQSRAGRLDWGAWLGVRQSRGAATRYKVYAEVTDGAQGLLARYLGAGGPLQAITGPGARLVMVGAEPGAQRCEFYFDSGRRGLGHAHLRALLDHVGLVQCQADLASLVHAFDFRHGQATDGLPQAWYGFSYSVLPQGRDPVFSLHVFAADLSGGDVWIRAQVLDAAQRRGFDLGGYAALTEPLVGRNGRCAFHNMLTFSVGADGVPSLQVCLSPPPDSFPGE